MARLDALDVLSRKMLQGKLQGERRSKRRGQSVEFADHRPYVAGDDLRFVDWNIYGRLEQLFLKLFLEEQDLTVHLLVDTSGSMETGEPSKMRFAKQTGGGAGVRGPGEQQPPDAQSVRRRPADADGQPARPPRICRRSRRCS